MFLVSTDVPNSNSARSKLPCLNVSSVRLSPCHHTATISHLSIQAVANPYISFSTAKIRALQVKALLWKCRLPERLSEHALAEGIGKLK